MCKETARVTAKETKHHVFVHYHLIYFYINFHEINISNICGSAKKINTRLISTKISFYPMGLSNFNIVYSYFRMIFIFHIFKVLMNYTLVIHICSMISFIFKSFLIIQTLFYIIVCIFILSHSNTVIIFHSIYLSRSCNLKFFVFMSGVNLYVYNFNGNAAIYNQYLSAEYLKTIPYWKYLFFKLFLNSIFITYTFEYG